MDLILPCYIKNQELFDLTRNAIESFGKVNLIVIDNASEIGGGYLREKADVYIRNQTNLGYAKAVNQGLKLSTTRYVAIANNDVRVSAGWQEISERILGECDNCYSLHFKMVNYDEPFNLGIRTWYENKERWCTSSFFIIDRSKYLFYFDENYLNSYCDWDYWYMVRKAGLKTVYTNMAAYQHKDSSTQVIIPEREENNKKNREFFKDKWGEYPEILFEKDFPEQVKLEWRGGFE